MFGISKIPCQKKKNKNKNKNNNNNKKKTTVTCGLFQIYFYENVFFPDNGSKIHNYKKTNQ